LGSGMPVSVGRRRSPRPAPKGTPEGARVAEAEPPGDLVYAEPALTEVEMGEPAAHPIPEHGRVTEAMIRTLLEAYAQHQDPPGPASR
jgi:hypothetical protein